MTDAHEPAQDWAHAPPERSGFAPHGLDEHLRAVAGLAAPIRNPNSGRRWTAATRPTR